MKNIQLYLAEKYKDNEKYKPIQDGIYQTTIKFDNGFKMLTDEEAKEFENIHPGEELFEHEGLKYMRDEDGKLFRQEVEDDYVMSLSFEQEPEFRENSNDQMVSQYPLEDVLDKYLVFVSDSYDALNEEDKERCYVEFASNDLKDLEALKEIIGKHVYDEYTQDEQGKESVKLIVE